MKLKMVALLLIIAAPVCSFAQHYADGAYSTLSIYSENGEPFLLILNGVGQNTAPTTRIRVELLPKFGNDIEIVFTDNRTPAIHRTITIADPLDNKAVNMTLKLVRYSDGAVRLKFHKCTEVDLNYHPERDEYVMSYNERLSNAVKMYRDMFDPPPSPMDQGSFDQLKATIKSLSSDDTRLSTARTSLISNYFSVEQLIEIAQLIERDQYKMEFVKAAYSKTTNQTSFYRLVNVFILDADKTELNDFISRQQH